MKKVISLLAAFFVVLSVFSQTAKTKVNYTIYINGTFYPTTATISKSAVKTLKTIEIKETSATGTPVRKIAKYTVVVSTQDKGGMGGYNEKKIAGSTSKLPAKAVALLANLKIGDKVSIKDLSIKNAEGKVVSVTGINFTVK